MNPVRKFPPPCWTRDEALVLIDAYRGRWHALHRAFLKNPDWDSVAEKVTSAFPNVTPPKTPAQCRHKMEKLRQRHRAEKQRAALFPGRFVSSWFFFDAMEAMEKNHDESGYNNNCNPEIISGIPLPDLHPGRGIPFIPNQGVILNDTLISHSRRVKPRAPSPTRKFGKMIYNNNNDNNNNNDEGDHDGETRIKVGKERKKRGIHEVVSCIKLLGEGFMKMENMKIDMARDIERMRMETEMKRYQLIMDSQKQIVDAVVKGLIETRKQPRTDVMTD